MNRGNRIGPFVVRLKKLATIAQHPSLWPALRSGVAAATEHMSVPLTTPGTVIDVGASHGQFALIANLRWPQARIIAFEPLPDAGAQLKQLLGEHVDLRPFAVGAHPGRATLRISRADDSSSLLQIGRRQIETFPGTEEVDSLDVQVVALADELGRSLSRDWLLKIDVQGYELEVLRGAEPILGRVREVYVECSFEELYDGQPLAPEIIDFLYRHNLRLAGVYNVTSVGGRAVQADMLFTHETSGGGAPDLPIARER